MPLNNLSLSVSAGRPHQPFEASVIGLTTGRVEVVNDGTPGFSVVNGVLRHPRLPGDRAVATAVLAEVDPGAGVSRRETRLDIAIAMVPQLNSLSAAVPDTITASGSAPITGSSGGTITVAVNPDGAWSVSGTTLSWTTAAVGKPGRPVLVESFSPTIQLARQSALGVSSASAASVIAPLSANMFYMGDSRIASFYNDSPKNNKNAGNHLVVANTQMGQRMVTIGNTAVAGQRSNEYNSSTATMTASTAGTLLVFGVVNDISQGRTGADCWATVKAIIDAALGAGKSVIAHTEPGAEAFSATQIGHRNTFNASLLAYAAANPATIRVFDYAAAALVDPTSTTSIAFKPNLSYDGIHLTNTGARAIGTAFAAWAATQIGGTPLNLTALQASNLAQNALFTTTTGGSTVTGITGPVPANWSGIRTGTGTGTITTGAAPDSNGNEMIVSATGSANNDRVQVQQSISAGIALNDRVRFAVEVAVDAGSVNLKSVRAYITAQFNGVTLNTQKFDMQPIAVHLNSPNTAWVDLLGPEILTVNKIGRAHV